MLVVVLAAKVDVVAVLAPTDMLVLLEIDPLRQPETLNNSSVPVSLDVNDTFAVKLAPGLVVVTLPDVMLGGVLS